MESLNKKIEKLIASVQKTGRYVGGERESMNINPALLGDAIKKYLKIDLYADVERINIFDASFKILE